MGELLTISDLRRLTGEPQHIINHALLRYGPEPAGRIGIARVWQRGDLPRIRESLDKTAVHSTRRDRRQTAGGRE
jgi:hypothetical protein